MIQKPNILFILTDQLSANILSQKAKINTPGIDKLQSWGISCDKAYSPNPICVPARASIFTGTSSCQNFVYGNTNDESVMNPNLESIGLRLKKRGYSTGYVGKWHIPIPIEKKEWSGFDYQVLNEGNEIDQEIPQKTIDFLREEREKPFFLVSSFINPHDICEYARLIKGLESKLKNGEVGTPPPLKELPPLPDNFEIPNDESSAIRDHQQQDHLFKTYPGRNFNEKEWREYRWAYNRLIELVDKQIEKILLELEKENQLENTWIVFSSDHGDGQGAHGWNQKSLFYDEVARVPFIIVPPKKEKFLQLESLKDSLINIGTDIFELFDTISKNDSITSLLKKWSNRKYITSTTNLFHSYGNMTKTEGRMIRSQNFKYTVFSSGDNPEMLFDLALDPLERRNIINETDYQDIKTLHREYLKEYQKLCKDPFIPTFNKDELKK